LWKAPENSTARSASGRTVRLFDVGWALIDVVANPILPADREEVGPALASDSKPKAEAEPTPDEG
jgi:hypothetical protein